MEKLTPIRRTILEYIKSSVSEKGYPPSVREICEAVGLKSPSTVHSHLKILKDNGFLEKDDHKTRAISLKTRLKYRDIPILGRVTAGLPILAVEETLGYIPFEDDGNDYFALLVRGDSMINAGILDGDTVVVRRQQTASHGEIVVALIGDEATVKRLYRKEGKLMLMPENDAYSPIVAENIELIGVVRAVYRKY
ncbi:MAG: transcriptional repressor LexA [Bacillota bacterium]|nr:transcriptional repressor LexA [Bacillota bacterium]